MLAKEVIEILPVMKFFQTLECSFSSVWTATIARVGAFFHISRDLQNEHSFAPLRSQFFSKNMYQILANEIIIISFAE